MGKFNSKSFNPQAFGAYIKRIPNVTKTELAKCGAVGANENARLAVLNQTGSLYATIPYFGRISGKTSQNNDGATDIKSTSTITFENHIKNQCNRCDVPVGLYEIGIGMVCGEFLLALKQTGQLDIKTLDLSSAVTQIKEGDTTVEFAKGYSDEEN